MRPLSRADGRGFTLVEIMVVVAIIGIIVAIAIPGFIKARRQSQAKACQEAQLKLNGAVMRYAMEENTTDMPSMNQLVNVVLYLQRTPRCPTTTTPLNIPPDHESEVSCPTSEPGHRIEVTPPAGG